MNSLRFGNSHAAQDHLEIRADQPQAQLPIQGQTLVAPGKLPHGLLGMPLETYMDIHKALTKGGDLVQPVSTVERGMYRMAELKQVLTLHGLTAGSRSKQEVLDAMEGMRLMVPVQLCGITTSQGAAAVLSGLSICAADLAKLGWAVPEQVDAVDVALQAPTVLTATAGAASASGQHGPGLHRGPAALSEGIGSPNDAQAVTAMATSPKAPLPQGVLCNGEGQAGAPQAGQTVHGAQEVQLAREEGDDSSGVNKSAEHEQQPVEAGPATSAPAIVSLSGQAVQLHATEEPGTKRRSTQGTDATIVEQPTALAAQSSGGEGAVQGVASGQWRTKKRAAVPAGNAGRQHRQQRAKLLQSAPGQPAPTETVHEPAREHATVSHVAPEEEAAGEQPLEPSGAVPDVATGWLAGQVRALARSAGGAALPADAGGSALVGRSVAFVLLEAFQSGRECVAAGLHVGRVVEPLGSSHMPDVCAPGCLQQHQFHFVRVNTSGVKTKSKSGRPVRVDLKVDLHPRLHQRTLDGLLRLPTSVLQDAWVLLEPVQ